MLFFLRAGHIMVFWERDMPKIKFKLLALISLVVLSSGSIAASNPLFESHEPLALVLELPPKKSLPPARDKPTVPGVLRYTDTDGTEVVFDIKVSTRGNSRLAQCLYPPLKIDLKKKQTASTLFAGQNKLKLVTQCSSSSTFQRYLNQEYIIYRMYNLLSEYSFRVRMLEVTYHFSSGGKGDRVQPAFFIESDKETAKRLEMATLKTSVINVSQLDARELSIFALFQFMIGNTDWSVRKGPGDEGCCHNGKVIAPPDSRNGWVVLPYDFDQAGMINTRYAVPSEQLPIRSVRQRLYRGYCSGNAELDSTIALFNDNRAAIEDLLNSGPDGSSENKAALRYLRSFYEIINDPKKRQKQIVDKCRRTSNRLLP